MKKFLSWLSSFALVLTMVATFLPAGIFSLPVSAATVTVATVNVSSMSGSNKDGGTLTFDVDFGTGGANYLKLNAGDTGAVVAFTVSVKPKGSSTTYTEGIISGPQLGSQQYKDLYMLFERTYYGQCTVTLKSTAGRVQTATFQRVDRGTMQLGTSYSASTAFSSHYISARRAYYENSSYGYPAANSTTYTMDVDFGSTGGNYLSLGASSAYGGWSYSVTVDGYSVGTINNSMSGLWLGRHLTGKHTVKLTQTSPNGNLTSVAFLDKSTGASWGWVPASSDKWFFTDGNRATYENGSYGYFSDISSSGKAVSVIMNFDSWTTSLRAEVAQPNDSNIAVYVDGSAVAIGSTSFTGTGSYSSFKEVVVDFSNGLIGRHLITIRTGAANVKQIAAHTHSSCTSGEKCQYCASTSAGCKYSTGACGYSTSACVRCGNPGSPSHNYVGSPTCGKSKFCKDCGVAGTMTSCNSSTSISKVDSTCTAYGYNAASVCSHCGILKSGGTQIAMKAHTSVNGGTYGVHQKCSVCGTTTSTTHSYTVDSGVQYSAATCTAPRYNYKKCACGYNPQNSSYIVSTGSANGHKFNTKSATSTYLKSSATCTAAATYYYKCDNCSVSSKDNTNTYYSYGSVAPSNHTGSSTYGGTSGVHTKYSCCGATISSSHSYTVDSGVQYTPATCTAPRYNYKKCACGYNPQSPSHIVATGNVNASNHTGKVVNAGTEGVHTKYDCCNATVSTSHSYSYSVTKAATCTATGTGKYTCSCGYHYTVTINKIPHDFTKQTATADYLKTPATHSAAAVYYKSCSSCNLSSKGQTGEATFSSGNPAPHSYGTASYSWSSDKSTCTATRTCSCGHSETETVKASVATTNATCTADGRKVYTADFVNSAFATQTEEVILHALQHKWNDGEITTPSTCTAEGVKTYTCLNDDSHTKTEPIAMIPHSYNAEVTAPTCTEKGFTTHTCSACGDSYKDSETPATGHSWGENGCVVCDSKIQKLGVSSNEKMDAIRFGFTLYADGVTAKGFARDITNATVTIDGETWKLEGFGAVVANKYVENMTIASVAGNTGRVIQIEANKVFSVEDNTVSFACGITNIPAQGWNVTIYGRAYFTVSRVVDGQTITKTIYSETLQMSLAEYHGYATKPSTPAA